MRVHAQMAGWTVGEEAIVQPWCPDPTLGHGTPLSSGRSAPLSGGDRAGGAIPGGESSRRPGAAVGSMPAAPQMLPHGGRERAALPEESHAERRGAQATVGRNAGSARSERTARRRPSRVGRGGRSDLPGVPPDRLGPRGCKLRSRVVMRQTPCGLWTGCQCRRTRRAPERRRPPRALETHVGGLGQRLPRDVGGPQAASGATSTTLRTHLYRWYDEPRLARQLRHESGIQSAAVHGGPERAAGAKPRVRQALAPHRL